MFVAKPQAIMVLLLGSVSTTTLACGDDDAASGGTSGASSSSGSAVILPDACSLISAAEVESLLGTNEGGAPLVAMTEGGDSHRCTWKRKYSTVLRTDELVISVAQAAAYNPSGPTALVGASPFAIGDDGQVLDQPRGVQAAWRKGALSASYRYSISGLFKDDFEPLRVRAKELAQAANARM